MNLLEQYIQPGYTTKLLKGQDSPVKGVVFVQFDGKVNCYGNIEQVHELFKLDEWQKIKKQGYYMA